MHCPYREIGDDFQYNIRGGSPALRLRVLDPAGNLLAEANAGRDGSATVRWNGLRSIEYSIEVNTGGPLGPATLTSELRRNGLKQDLR